MLFAKLILCSLEDEMLKSVNTFRKSNNMDILYKLDSIQRAAEYQSNVLCLLARLTHEGLDSSHIKLEDRLRGYDFVGENIGENIAKQQNDDYNEVLKLWIKSDEHRKNLLGDYLYTGVSTCKDRNGNRYWVQVFGKDVSNYMIKMLSDEVNRLKSTSRGSKQQDSINRSHNPNSYLESNPQLESIKKSEDPPIINKDQSDTRSNRNSPSKNQQPQDLKNIMDPPVTNPNNNEDTPSAKPNHTDTNNNQNNTRDLSSRKPNQNNRDSPIINQQSPNQNNNRDPPITNPNNNEDSISAKPSQIGSTNQQNYNRGNQNQTDPNNNEDPPSYKPSQTNTNNNPDNTRGTPNQTDTNNNEDPFSIKPSHTDTNNNPNNNRDLLTTTKPSQTNTSNNQNNTRVNPNSPNPDNNEDPPSYKPNQTNKNNKDPPITKNSPNPDNNEDPFSIKLSQTNTNNNQNNTMVTPNSSNPDNNKDPSSIKPNQTNKNLDSPNTKNSPNPDLPPHQKAFINKLMTDLPSLIQKIFTETNPSNDYLKFYKDKKYMDKLPLQNVSNNSIDDIVERVMKEVNKNKKVEIDVPVYMGASFSKNK